MSERCKNHLFLRYSNLHFSSNLNYFKVMTMKNYQDWPSLLESVKCVHIYRAVDVQDVQNTINRTGLLKDCPECKQLHNHDFTASSLWLCLKCGNQACGRAQNQHALNHFKTRSNYHAVCVNTSSRRIWCYACNREIAITYSVDLDEDFRDFPVVSSRRLVAVLEYLIEQTVDGSLSHIAEKNCKYCKKNVIGVKICTKCQELYHTSCAQKVKVCCEGELFEKSPLELSELSITSGENKSIIQIIKDKEEIIAAKNYIIKLLTEKIETLTASK